MSVTTHHQRLARIGALSEVWEEMEAEEKRAKKARQETNWRKVLRTKAMREDAAQLRKENTCPEA